MKAITKMSRLVVELEKIFNALNADFFDGELEAPIITVIPTPNAYGHYVPAPIWKSGENRRRELNIGAGTLDREIEYTVATLLHECIHLYLNEVKNIQDTSRGGMYHNKEFKKACDTHGLICTRTEKYGWSHTEPSDELLEWIWLHDEFNEIEICRSEYGYTPKGTGSNTTDGGTPTRTKGGNSHSIRYVCPNCHCIARTTRELRLICADCMQLMIEG